MSGHQSKAPIRKNKVNALLKKGVTLGNRRNLRKLKRFETAKVEKNAEMAEDNDEMLEENTEMIDEEAK